MVAAPESAQLASRAAEGLRQLVRFRGTAAAAVGTEAVGTPPEPRAAATGGGGGGWAEMLAGLCEAGAVHGAEVKGWLELVTAPPFPCVFALPIVARTTLCPCGFGKAPHFPCVLPLPFVSKTVPLSLRPSGDRGGVRG